MNNPSVSVCVPVYNASKYLPECLDSLINQTLKDIEIVCVDDGSTDDSLTILQGYARRYRNIKVIHQENKGLGGARDAGIQNATGEFIGFLDADDKVGVRMYETLYNLAKQQNAEIAFCNLQFFPKGEKTNKKVWYNPYRGEISGEFLHRNTQPWNKIISRKLIKRIGLKFEKNDSVCLLWMAMSNGIVSTDKKLYYYRVGHSSMSVNYKLGNFIDTEYMLIKHREVLRKNQNLEKRLGKYFEFNIIFNIIQTLTVSALQENKKVFREQQKLLKSYNYKNNPYCRKILKPELGIIKYIASVYILPNNYYLSKKLTKIALGGNV